MKTLTFILIMACTIVHAGNREVLDTIYGNERMNTALFFPSEIRQGIGGAQHIIFSYNREKGQKLGLLKVLPGRESNLLVITADGRAYSYIIKYREVLERLNYFLDTGDALRGDRKTGAKEPEPNTRPADDGTAPKKTEKTDAVLSERETDFLKRSSVSLLKLPERRNVRRTKNGISLALKNKVYHKDRVFLQFELRNRSGIDLDIEDLRISKIKGNKKRKASYQELEMEPLYIHDMQGVVRHGETLRFVYVLPKFGPAKKEKVQIVLYGGDGSRYVTLNLK